MQETNDNILHVERLSKEFTTERGEQLIAVDNVNLNVSSNEFVCIVGPSGCGKSTMLRIIAGLEEASAGNVRYRGTPVTKPGKRIGMVFQEYSLFPWLSVLDNTAAGLEFAGIPRERRREQAKEYLKIVGMSEFAEAYPHELSGGMRQRVAIARALANDPDVLLMDEPFGALDAHTRILLQRELLRIWEMTHKTILFVTHSVDEAVYLADRIIIMSHRPGKIRDVLTVDMDRPRSRAMPEFGKLTDSILTALEY
ncbi:ABC transporter ATP-binding protein [Halodesulfovibrio marinisediminis]|uniref:NitT/TauT family transport system ATP-binding protein n=1 Tax=Halodesulfovibrio marinisediminis DSM 17456 TaxID=1121457 RepID=A0A1N6HZJ3_9BACT|nr:ABC transporter ATP-binding protein [Halodesulfovibrio marinisediminis]SIO25187.1 NitT/TauT family transport system ATP-binding protein [Halodesulfovibrio marinisediminis DSM 17456]